MSLGREHGLVQVALGGCEGGADGKGPGDVGDVMAMLLIGTIHQRMPDGVHRGGPYPSGVNEDQIAVPVSVSGNISRTREQSDLHGALLRV